MADNHEKFMRRAIDLASEGADENLGGPFGCVVVKEGQVIGEGCNQVTSTRDPTAHAEMVAIRQACQRLDSFQLDGCTIYASCEPCPMCLGAIYWSRPTAVYFAATRQDAAAAGFDDELFYSELDKPNEERQLKMINLLRDQAKLAFRDWIARPDKIEY
ncbi:MAG: nucleoside deaminase [Acidobacteria bacterium]|nr:nucleoside deaminase [Acidobacteriota bacterium]MCA1609177.1 nucleoside deaminase [Acidobacteriota bacterium]